jgi:hypothetical protein
MGFKILKKNNFNMGFKMLNLTHFKAIGIQRRFSQMNIQKGETHKTITFVVN